jgi:vacuolar-type H+-ATPase subunit H
MKDTIEQLLKVEAEARELVAELQAQAEKVVADARAEAARIEDAAQRAAQAQAERLLDECLAEARARREAALQEIDRRNASLCRVSQDKADAARTQILSALIGQ